jgi:hypothetical protein
MNDNTNTNNKYLFTRLGIKDEYYFENIRIYQVLKLLLIYNRIFGQRFRINYPKLSFSWFRSLILFKYRISKKNFIRLIRILKYKRRLRNHDDTLTLKRYGEYCTIVNKGYKVFNFEKNIVIKIFREDIPSQIILRELELVKKSQNTKFAPALIRWNLEEKWYEEKLVKGDRDFSHFPRDSKNLLMNFRNSVGPALQNIMLSKTIEANSLTQIHNLYSRKIIEVLDTRKSIKDESKKKIITFLDKRIEILKAEGNTTIYLGFSHGDFCPANILSTHKGISLIDWEGAGIRSILFDFYSYFFYLPVHQIFNDFLRLFSDINRALDILISSMEPHFKELKENIKENERIYRVIYYIERIVMLTERIDHDEKLNIEKIILDFINAFDKYDAEMKAHNLTLH